MQSFFRTTMASGFLLVFVAGGGGCARKGASNSLSQNSSGNSHIAAAGAGVGSPDWTPIEQVGQPMEYFRYNSQNTAGPDAPQNNCQAGYNCEEVGTVDASAYPPVHFYWQPSVPIGFRSMLANCAVTNQPDKNIFWFDPSSGAPLGDTNPPHLTIPPPGEFTVTQQMIGVNGFMVKGNPFGDATDSSSTSAASAIMYFTDRRCSDGNNEYGFNYNLVNKTLLFYYSVRTNCYAGAGCRSQNSFDSAPQNQQDNLSTVLTDLSNVSPNASQPLFYFTVYFVPDTPQPGTSTGYRFRVQVLDGYDMTKLANCRTSPGAPIGPCSVDVPIQDFFPVSQVLSGPGYIVLGTSTSYDGNPTDSPVFKNVPTYFDVEGVWSHFSQYGDLPPAYIPPLSVETQMENKSSTPVSWDVWNFYYNEITGVQLGGPGNYFLVDPSKRSNPLPLSDWWACTQQNNCAAAQADLGANCTLRFDDLTTGTSATAATGSTGSITAFVGNNSAWSVYPSSGGSYSSSYLYYWDGTKNNMTDLNHFGPQVPSLFNGGLPAGSQGTYTRTATVTDSQGNPVCKTGTLTIVIQ